MMILLKNISTEDVCIMKTYSNLSLATNNTASPRHTLHLLLICMKVSVLSHQVLICINREVSLSSWLWNPGVDLDENCSSSPD